MSLVNYGVCNMGPAYRTIYSSLKEKEMAKYMPQNPTPQYKMGTEEAEIIEQIGDKVIGYNWLWTSILEKRFVEYSLPNGDSVWITDLVFW
jgi:hypothetical protein